VDETVKAAYAPSRASSAMSPTKAETSERSPGSAAASARSQRPRSLAIAVDPDAKGQPAGRKHTRMPGNRALAGVDGRRGGLALTVLPGQLVE
jgi:hypothetical protein